MGKRPRREKTGVEKTGGKKTGGKRPVGKDREGKDLAMLREDGDVVGIGEYVYV